MHHREKECTGAHVPCPFKKHGCNDLVVRSEVEAHVNKEFHRTLLLKKIQDGEDLVETMTNKVETLTKLTIDLKSELEVMSAKVKDLEAKAEVASLVVPVTSVVSVAPIAPVVPVVPVVSMAAPKVKKQSNGQSPSVNHQPKSAVKGKKIMTSVVPAAIVPNVPAVLAVPDISDVAPVATPMASSSIAVSSGHKRLRLARPRAISKVAIVEKADDAKVQPVDQSEDGDAKAIVAALEATGSSVASDKIEENIKAPELGDNNNIPINIDDDNISLSGGSHGRTAISDMTLDPSPASPAVQSSLIANSGELPQFQAISVFVNH